MENAAEIVILVVDDDPPILKALKFILESEGYRVIPAANGETALAAARREPPDLVISDVNMPGLDGFGLCRGIRSMPGRELCPFVFLTAERSVDSKVTGFSSGANAYLIKPFEPAELTALVRANLERHRAYEEQALRDPLTGISNRRALFRLLESELSRARRYHRVLSVAMLDLDRFKELNDRLGHLAGDRALVGVSEVFSSRIRKEDILGRYGGEEFLIALPETDLSRAVILLERLREEVAASRWPINGEGEIVVTVSIGVAQAREDDDVETLLMRADRALYRAKAAGRNRTETENAVTG